MSCQNGLRLLDLLAAEIRSHDSPLLFLIGAAAASGSRELAPADTDRRRRYQGPNGLAAAAPTVTSLDRELG